MNKCTVLLDNNNENFSHAKASHGLSLFLEIDELRILFDTGPNSDFIDNAILLKKNLNTVDSVVLSHAHYDHSCGYRSFADDYRCRELICSDKFFFEKVALIDGMYFYKGINFDDKFLNCHAIHTELVEKTLKLSSNVFVHSNIKNTEEFEPLPDKYFILKDGKYEKDEFLDESVLVVDNEDGLTLIVGCSHPGIVSIVKEVEALHNKKVKVIIGGLHLAKANENRIKKTVEALETLGVEEVFLGHCTGYKVVEYMRKTESKIKSHYFSTGAIISF
ncbi:MAG: MBL fold metallo-hydrolase [Pleomorphochaeta sp.]